MDQSQNPATATTQTIEETVTTEPSTLISTNGGKITTIRRIQTTIGAAQKDTAREIAAKLGSFRFIQYIGVAVFLFGAASAFWPPLKIITGGSITTSVIIVGAGLLLIVLPVLVVGHELLILGATGGVAGVWFLAHRHGQLRGRLDANHEQVDEHVSELVDQMKSAKAEDISKLLKEGDKYPGGGPALKAAAALPLQELGKQ